MYRMKRVGPTLEIETGSVHHSFHAGNRSRQGALVFNIRTEWLVPITRHPVHDFFANASACSLVRRFSLGSSIHSRMILRRASCSGLISPSPQISSTELSQGTVPPGITLVYIPTSGANSPDPAQDSQAFGYQP